MKVKRRKKKKKIPARTTESKGRTVLGSPYFLHSEATLERQEKEQERRGREKERKKERAGEKKETVEKSDL